MLLLMLMLLLILMLLLLLMLLLDPSVPAPRSLLLALCSFLC